MLGNLFHNIFLRGDRLLNPGIKLFSLVSFSSSEITEDKSIFKNKKVIIDRTITAEDVNLFSKLTGDFNTIHSPSENKPAVVHGAFLNGIVSGVIGTKLPGDGTVVISQTLNFPKPCHIGDTIEVSVELENVRKIVTCKYEVVNKFTRDVVLHGNAKLLYQSSKNNK